jgi:asparagine synthase (glutamine-hydrolysing)
MIATRGLDKTLPELIGMFAFSLWDRKTRTLSLVRDRIGIKPLYWGQFGRVFLFASELKAIRAHPVFSAEIDRGALVSLLRHNYVRAPHSIYRGVSKLGPGEMLTVTADGEPVITNYWTLDPDHAGAFAGGDQDETSMINELEGLIKDAVGRRMISDVPLGAFLSGGVDSSLVTAMMQAGSSTAIRTFTIGFDQRDYDEAVHAKAVAAHLGTDHTELYVDPSMGRDLIPRLPQMFDEPFADASQIPTYLVSELTRRHVTVALSGDGGDENFAGYTRYLWADRIWKHLESLPRPIRKLGAAGIRTLSPASWDKIISMLPKRFRAPQAGERLYKMADILPADSIDAVYRGLISQWQTPGVAVPNGTEPGGLLWDDGLAKVIPDAITRMQYLDTLTYLPDDILTKVDRASMAVSLEARVPLLDHRIVEYAWRMPRALKVKNGVGKYPLREILYKYVPREMIERPKQGFAVPIGDWLRGPLRDWGEDLLSEKRLAEGGYFNPAPIRRFWTEHQSGRRNRQYQLWGPLMFQAWLESTGAP